MTRIFGAVLVVVLAGCAQMPPPPVQPGTLSACAQHDSSYECQVERYNAIGTQ